jgi:hypothetical protein
VTGTGNEDKPPDPAEPGQEAAEQGNSGAAGPLPPVPARPKPNLVDRATALRGLSIARPRTPDSTLRRRSLADIRSKDPEIPYGTFEIAARNLVCALMARQDRMNEEIFNRIIDIEYRVRDIEIDLRDLMEKRGRS